MLIETIFLGDKVDRLIDSQCKFIACFLTNNKNGKTYDTNYDNLDVIISVDYRVISLSSN